MSGKSRGKRQLWIGFLLLGAALIGLFLAAKWLFGSLATLDARLSAGLITASATVFVAVVSVLVSKHLEVKTTIRARLREKKEPIYKELIDFIFEVTFAQKLGRKMPSEEQMIEVMAKTTRDLVSCLSIVYALGEAAARAARALWIFARMAAPDAFQR